MSSIYVNAYCGRCGTQYQAMSQFLAAGKSQCPACCSKDIRKLGEGQAAPTVSQLKTVEQPKSKPVSQSKSKPVAQLAKTKPIKQIEQPAEPKSNGKYQVFGKYAGTAVVRWLGKAGFELARAKKALQAVGAALPEESTLKIQLRAGKKGERGEPAALTAEEAQQLLAVK